MDSTAKLTTEKPNLMQRVARTIVDSRYLIFLLFAIMAIYCVLSIGRVHTNGNIAAFLPKDMETRRCLSVMESEFTGFATADIMISNVTYETAERLAEEIGGLPRVASLGFDDSPAHYTSSSALLTVLFAGNNEDEDVIASMERIQELIEPYDRYVWTEVGRDYNEVIAGEMGGILIIAAIVIAAVLLLTSRSYFEVVIFAIVFVFAALLNMGTNFWLGEISSITNSIAIIMQLALAIDYAIIFAHRYQDETHRQPTLREALIEALAKSISEIASSSLTTIAGLAALTLMRFRLGYDLGIVLAKGIICSMLTVFLLMPGLILLFPRALQKTEHRNLIPNLEGWGRFLMRGKFALVIVFALILPVAIWCSGHTEYAFADKSISEIVYNERRAAQQKIRSTFSPLTTTVVMLRGRNYAAEKAILQELETFPEIKTATGLAGVELANGHVLTDSVAPRAFAELLDIDVERARLLYQAYGVEHGEYQALFGASSDYQVPLVDMFLYLFEKVDQGVVTLTPEQTEHLVSLRGQLEQAVGQLRGENWDRLVLGAAVADEGEESVAFVENIRSVALQYYGRDDVMILGDITVARDLRESYSSDSVLINVLTIGFVFAILLFTFRSPVAAAVLVFAIQGCIWINFSFPYLTDTHCSFVTNMIVSAIQMGATIDYAIVLMSRYLAQRQLCDTREAMAKAVSEAFPTVFTSGSIMTMAGFLIGYRVSDVYVGHIGLAVGRGALISVVLVLTVLPQLIVLFDKAIAKTTFVIPTGRGGVRESTTHRLT